MIPNYKKLEIEQLLLEKLPHRQIASLTGISRGTIDSIANGKYCPTKSIKSKNLSHAVLTSIARAAARLYCKSSKRRTFKEPHYSLDLEVEINGKEIF